MKMRLYFLDNLRTFLIFLVIVVHAGIVYESILVNTWIVSDPSKANSIGIVRMYLELFIMFTLFYISGYFIPQSLKNKSILEFLKSKFKRIMVPWIIAVLTLIPLYKVIFLYSRGLPQEQWFSYFHFFRRVGGDPGSFADNPVQNWLWFLPVLFLFQVIYLLLSKSKILNLSVPIKTAVFITFIIGIIYGLVISELNLVGWYHSALLHFQNERFLIYFAVFLLGSLCYRLDLFNGNKLNKKYYIISNVSLTVSIGIYTVVALNLFFNMIDANRDFYFISPFVDRIFYYTTMMLSMLSFLHILLYSFYKYLNHTNNILRKLNRHSYNVYIIHVIIIGILSLILVGISIPPVIKYFILIIFTFLFSNLLLEAFSRIRKKPFSFRSLGIITLFGLLTVFAFSGILNQAGATKINSEVQLSSDTGKSIMHAAVSGDLLAIQKHIEDGSDLDQRDPPSGSTPLISAAAFGHTEVALALIQSGANLDLQNNDGSTALITAAYFCRVEIVEALLKHGANLSIKNKSGADAIASVSSPFEDTKAGYEFFNKNLGHQGMALDLDYIQKTRPVINKLLEAYR